MQKRGLISFLKNHRILTHLILMFFVLLVILYFAVSYMDDYTRHGVEVTVPEIKNLTVEEATPILERESLKCQVIDSIYNKNLRPGIIIEQVPSEGSTIKREKDIYVVINTIMPRQMPFPEIKDISYRQAISMLEGVGFPKPEIEFVKSQYKDLVVGAKYRNKEVLAGDKYPLTAKFTIIVGKGMKYEPTDTLNIDNIEL